MHWEEEQRIHHCRLAQSGKSEGQVEPLSTTQTSQTYHSRWLYIPCRREALALLAILFSLHENPQRLLRAELDALADDIRELAHREVAGHEILLLVDVSNLRACGSLLHDHRNAIVVLAPDLLRFRAPLLCTFEM